MIGNGRPNLLKNQNHMIKAGSPLPTPLPDGLSNRTLNTLARYGITTVEQVTDAYPVRLLKIPGFGLTALREVEIALFPWQQYTPARRKRGRQPRQPTVHTPPTIAEPPINCVIKTPIDALSPDTGG